MSCKKLVDIPAPISDISEANIFTDDGTAVGALSGIYSQMSSFEGSFSGRSSITHFAGLSSDELTLYEGFLATPFVEYYQNDLKSNQSINAGSELWAPLYNYIYQCNAAITGLTFSNTLTPRIKQQLLGEAKFLRAFIYFYLVNLFGDIPLVLTTDYKQNTLMSRTSKEQVYKQIILDLADAESSLSTDYLDHSLMRTTTERVRPTKWAAIALLARVFLYTEDFPKAEEKATLIINNSSLFSLSPLSNVFHKNSSEAIWQIQPTTTGFNTWDAYNFILSPNGPRSGADQSVYLSTHLLNCFELGDQRRYNGIWIDSVVINSKIYFYAFKYKQNTFNQDVNSVDALTEYLMILRLGEQYLIRAESRIKTGNLEGAKSDLDAIRTRAGLENTNATDNDAVVIAIQKERQAELFTEMGHRWLDLKRTNTVDSVMESVTSGKGGLWQTTDQLYPLSFLEILSAPNLTQNEGY